MIRSTTSLLLAALLIPACGDDGSGETTSDTIDATTTGNTTATTTGNTASTTDIPTTDTPTTGAGPGTTTDEPGTSTGDDTTGAGTTTGGDEVLLVPGFETPESVAWDADYGFWYVSNIVGDATTKDGNGYISRLNADGSVDNMQWITGLDGPKGLRTYDGVIGVADIDTVRVYDLADGAEIISVTIPGAVFLNDVVFAPDDYLYVSDTGTNSIHRLGPGDLMAELVLSDMALDAPNGLIYNADQLFVAAIGSVSDPMILGELLLVDQGNVTPQGAFEGKLDGIEVDGDAFLVTDFTGKLFRVGFDGQNPTLLRDFVVEDGMMSSADFGFDPATRMAGIPDLYGNQVAFYLVP